MSHSGVDVRAVQALVVGHQDYARALARDVWVKLGKRVEYDELASLALLGLTQAANDFDPTAGVAFTTFSYYRIRGSMYDGVRKMRLAPTDVKRQAAREYAQTETLGEIADTSVARDPQSMAQEFDIAIKQTAAVFLVSQLADGESMPDPESADESPVQSVENRELLGMIGGAMESLGEKERTLVRRVYFDGLSITDVAAEWKVHKSTVSRMHAKVLEALYTKLAGEKRADAPPRPGGAGPPKPRSSG